MPKVLIESKDIVKCYGQKTKVEVLHKVNLKIYEKDFATIIGPSGSGKTTLLNILGTLDEPTSGDILFRDKSIIKKNNKDLSIFRNENIGFIFQFHYLIPEFTALENVLIPTWIKSKRPTNRLKKRAEELLELVGLSKVKNNMARDMSGGQQQRVAIARSLINSPAIIFADEPTGNLDTESTDNVYDLLRQVHKEMETTFLIVTHDMNLAQKCDRIIKMVDGNIHTDKQTQ